MVPIGRASQAAIFMEAAFAEAFVEHGAFMVEHKPLDDEFLDGVGGPDTELGSLTACSETLS